MNKLIVIGWTGIKTCYLNISREEAIRRYIAAGNEFHDDGIYDEFEFEDEFDAYDVYPRN